MPTTVIAIPTGTGSFLIPADFPSGGTLQVECVGAGGQANSGGGAYSKTTAISVNPLQTVYIQVGNSGVDTWFNKTSNVAPTSTTDGCLAKAGTPVTSLVDLAPGGQSSAGVGDVKYSGGNGGTYVSGPPDVYGGGGGAAGPNGAGASAGAFPDNGGGGANGGSTGSGTTGGNGRGGSGGGASGNGSNGGGGGGAIFPSTSAGSGGPDLIWTDFAGVQWGPCGGGGGNNIVNQTGGQGYGGGACRTSDVGTSASSQGLIVLTYTTGSASASFVDAAPFITTVNNNVYAYLGYWYIPYGVSSLKVECVGASNPTNITMGGGAYATRTLTLTPGGPLYLNAGSTVTSADPDTWVNPSSGKPSSATNTVLAKGTITTTGGAAGSSFGSTAASGGNAAVTINVAGNGGAAGPNGAGANGGTGNVSSNNGIGGGGGATNGGSAGAASGSYASRIGGAGGNNRLGSGAGSGANVTINATNGTNGAGGGGGSVNTTNSILLLAGCGGVENIWTTTTGNVYGVAGGAGGRSRLNSTLSGYVSGGSQGFGARNGVDSSGGGLIVFTYTYVAPVIINYGNFLEFF